MLVLSQSFDDVGRWLHDLQENMACDKHWGTIIGDGICNVADQNLWRE